MTIFFPFVDNCNLVCRQLSIKNRQKKGSQLQLCLVFLPTQRHNQFYLCSRRMAFISIAPTVPFCSKQRSQIFSIPIKNKSCVSTNSKHHGSWFTDSRDRSKVTMTKNPFLPYTETVSLPQNDRSPKHRRRQIERARQNYEWSQELIKGVSMVKKPPREESPDIGWWVGFLNVFTRVYLNHRAIKSKVPHKVHAYSRKVLQLEMAEFNITVLRSKAARQFDDIWLTRMISKGWSLIHAEIAEVGRSLADYRKLFKYYKPPSVSLDPYLDDDVFGWYRVAGPNPMEIKKLKSPVSYMFPELSNEILQGISSFGDDTIESLQKDQRLFYVSYPEFSGLKSGVLPDGKRKDGYYVYAPTALLAIPRSPEKRTTVLPIAIRCDQDMNFRMYTPNKVHTDATTWSAAKLTVQVADSVKHETVHHLGRTHLLIGVFNCAARRSMALNHPIMKLLKPHFYGTCYINSKAAKRLVNPGGIMDKLTAPKNETTIKVVAGAIHSSTFSFNNWMPDKELASRGVLHAEKLRFPYRDYAVRVWEAIIQWVSSYVAAYYKSDYDVRNDIELKAWCMEIIDKSKGNLHGFGDNESGEIKTKDYLIRLVSMIIFTASFQHSAVNFPQSSLMQFVPAMPLCGHYPALNSEKPFETFDEFVTKMMPSLKNAKIQMDVSELIGVYQYTTLGKYDRSLKFSPKEVKLALKKFQEQLKLISADIQTQNDNEKRLGLQPCFQLNPKHIPQSINI